MNAPNTIALAGEHNGAPLAAMAEAETSRAVQEIQAALVIAKRFPRDENAAVNRILSACQRPSMAEEALYTYARGGTEISGPSIRLAEVMARAWGNIEFGWREVERRGNVSTVQTWAWDMETNTRKPMTFEVKHVRNTKKGSYPLTDERDIYENMANNAARRLRACILAMIPGDIQAAATEQCEKTIASQVTTEKVEALAKAFSAFGVNVAMIEERIQRKLDSISGSQVVDLRRIYSSLKDGMSAVSTWFNLDLADKPQETESETVEDQDTLEAFKNQVAKKDKMEKAPPEDEHVFPGDLPSKHS